jgi:hypothetical protein
MRSRPGTITACIAVAALAACSSSNNATRSAGGESTKVAVSSDSLDRGLDKLDPEFSINPSSGGFYLAFVAGAGGAANSEGMMALHSIDSITFRIYGPDDRLIDSRSTSNIASGGVMNQETNSASITASAGVQWTPTSPLPAGSYGIMIVHGKHGIVSRRRPFPLEASTSVGKKPLRISIDIENNGPAVEFIVTVERTGPIPEGEYRPSGERARIELENESAETIWSSSEGKMFTQEIGSVEPADIGEKAEYRFFWDGRSNLTHGRLRPGTYRVIATIPAKPVPYIQREEFTWGG